MTKKKKGLIAGIVSTALAAVLAYLQTRYPAVAEVIVLEPEAVECECEEPAPTPQIFQTP